MRDTAANQSERHVLVLQGGGALGAYQAGAYEALASYDQALAAGYGWRALPLGGLGRGTGARALAAWPLARRLARAFDVVYLNGTVCGRLLPALPPGAARRVLHVHDLVRRVPRFWRRAARSITAPSSDKTGCSSDV